MSVPPRIANYGPTRRLHPWVWVYLGCVVFWGVVAAIVVEYAL